MIIKQPVVIDVSHWETIPDFALVEPQPILVLTKATEGLTFVDSTFTKYMGDLKKNKIHRGCYHFHRKLYKGLDQAKFFCETIRLHVDDQTILVLDVEEGGESADQLQAWLIEVERQYPRNLIMIYSSKRILDPIPMTTDQKAFFKRFPIWTAGYPANPDLYTEVHSSYIPDQTKYGPVWLWQYTDQGLLKGIKERVDLNWIHPDLLTYLGETTQDSITFPFPGVKRITGRRYGSNFYLTILDPAQVRFEVLCFENLAKPSRVSQERNAQMAWNGDGWDTRLPPPHKPLDLAISNGKVIVPRKTSKPSFDLQGAKIFHEGSTGTQVFSGFRYIMLNGSFPLNYGDDEYVTELHPRSAKGLDSHGNVMCFTCDGRSSSNRGMTLLEVYKVLREFECVTAFDHDSGGSSVEVLNGVVQNHPSDGIERSVVMTILAYTKGDNTMSTGKAKEILGKIGTVRSSPEVLSGNDTQKRIPAYSTIEFVEIVPGKSIPQDQWFKLPDGTYLNYILGGRAYYQVISQPEVPTPKGYSVTVTIIDDNGLTGSGIIEVK
jgi:GH25 family lysozyme M1 (1,4-beta-N-acetylmuramidase)